MPQAAQCEFFLLRYVPDAVKNEFINVGVVLVQTDPNGSPAFADVRFTSDFARVRCLDPEADIEMLRALESEIRQRIKASPRQRAELLQQIKQSFSNVIQVDEPKACVAEEPAREIEQLAQSYLESSKPGRASRPASASSRGAVLQAMRRSFEDAGVWPLMQKQIPVAQYTFSADPLKIDCGYKPNGTIRMFHALSFDSDAASSKALAFSFPELRAGIEREQHAGAELTAIVAEGYDRDDDAARFATSILRKSEIQLATTADLAMLAERARIELRL